MSARYGDGDDCNWIATQAISGTTAVVSRIIDMRDLNQVAMTLKTTGTVNGTWLIEGSNNFVPQTSGTPGASSANIAPYGEAADTTPEWTTITAAFVTDVSNTAIANPAGTALEQPAWNRDPLGWRALKITFTPASGDGNVTVLGFAKGWG